MDKRKKQQFEPAMQQLEKIVAELETGDLPLDKAIEKFEEGVKLSKFCSEKLDESEKRISILLKNPRGKPVEQPFFPESSADIIPEEGE